ncbi:MAG: type II toxin-antitoxin system VapC family toxin [Candidatus Sericytochromatia bacterium]|nr:type II toxin-antitoxin system VapC family toxin [Candidatus Sericytochromatia bacterium]
MKLLLDTQIALWWLAEPGKLTSTAFKAIQSPSHEVFVSAASVWEMAIKQQLGKLEIPGSPQPVLEAGEIQLLDVSAEDGWCAGSLPPLHRDPFDRMLVAQALRLGLVVVTRDEHIPKYGVATLPG